MGVVPLTDASRRPTRMPVVTASIIAANALVFILELVGGDAFVTKRSSPDGSRADGALVRQD